MSHAIIDGLAIGNVPLSIFDIVEHVPEYFDDFGMLITCMDSGTDVAAGADCNSVLFEGAEKHGNAVFVPVQTVAKHISDGWSFDGFEEIYLLRVPEPDLKIYGDEHFTSECFDFSKSVPDSFLERFRYIKAVRFLSDGVGLNFACEPAFAEKIEELDQYLREGEPTNQFEVDAGCAPRRAYYLPLKGTPNSCLSRTSPRRHKKQEQD
jgi:hypothetical protein